MATPRPAGPAADGTEEAIRCRDLAAMTAFYRDIVGLDVLEEDEPGIAVRLGDGERFAGPVRIVLFAAEDEDESLPVRQHLTLVVADAGVLDRTEAWFRANGLVPGSAEQAWAGWKCLSVRDPEGNTVELAAPVRQRTLPAAARQE